MILSHSGRSIRACPVRYTASSKDLSQAGTPQTDTVQLPVQNEALPDTAVMKKNAQAMATKAQGMEQLQEAMKTLEQSGITRPDMTGQAPNVPEGRKKSHFPGKETESRCIQGDASANHLFPGSGGKCHSDQPFHGTIKGTKIFLAIKAVSGFNKTAKSAISRIY